MTAESEKLLWFITFVTRNSRVSERMVEHGIQLGEPFVFTVDEQIRMAQKIQEALQKYCVRAAAWNILPDHVHMVVAASRETYLNDQIRKIKGYSSYAFKQIDGYEKGRKIWAQKFHRKQITDEKMFSGVVEYVMNNHLKHGDRWGKRLITTWESHLKHIIEPICIPLEEILQNEDNQN